MTQRTFTYDQPSPLPIGRMLRVCVTDDGETLSRAIDASREFHVFEGRVISVRQDERGWHEHELDGRLV